MKSHNIFFVIALFLLCTTPTFAVDYDFSSLREIIDRSSLNTVDIEAFTNTSGRLDLNLSRGDIKVELYDVKNIDDLSLLYLNPNLEYDTSAVTISDIQIDFATIYLKKNTKNIGTFSIMHSDDGINFTRTDTPFYQNITHIWFNVSHFSSWIASLNSPLEVIIDNTETLDLDDYISFTAGDYVQISYQDSSTSTYIDNKLSSTQDDVYDSSGSNMIYQIGLDGNNILSLNPQPSIPNNYYQDNFFTIRVLNSADSIVLSDVVGIVVRTYQEPTISTFSARDITDVSATLRGESLFNDHTGGVSGRFRYRVQGTSTWTYTAAQSISDNTVFDESITGLTASETYEYQAEISWNSQDTSSSLVEYGDTETFTTNAPAGQPTVDTVTPSVGDGSAYFKALVDFGTYTGGDIRLWWEYRAVGDATWIEIPTGAPTGAYLPSDGEVFTSSQVTGLTNGVEYELRARIDWNSGTESDIGEILSFTPSSPSSLTDNLVLYYSFDNDDLNGINPLDLTPNGYNGTNNGADTGQTGVIDESFDFVSSNSDYISSGDQDDFSWTDGSSDTAGSISFWINADSWGGGTVPLGKFADSGNREWKWYAPTDSKLRFTMFDTTAGNAIGKIIDTVLNTGQWYHIVVTYDGSETEAGIKIYVDGTEATTTSGSYGGSYPGMSNTGQALELGRDRTSYMDAKLDELAIWKGNELTSEQVLELYNSGNGKTYPFIDEFITVSALSPQNINYESALLRGVGDFNETIFTLYPGFRWRENGTSVWSNYTSSLATSGGSSFSYGITNLTYDTTYEYQAYLENESGFFYFSNTSYFDTLSPPDPILDTLNAFDVDNDSATLRGSFEFEGWENVNAYFRWREVGQPTFDNITTIVLYNYSENTTHILNYNLTGLIPERDYEYLILLDYGAAFGNTVSGDIQSFSTTETGAPIINTQYPVNITRTEATLRGELSYLGFYDSIDLYFILSNSTTSRKSETFTLTEPGFVYKYYDDLAINATYDVELIAEYGISRNVSGGVLDFKTLSLEDFIQPSVSGQSVLDNDIGFNSTTVYAIVDLEDVDNASIYYEFTKVSDGTGFTSISFFINESGSYPYFTDELQPNTEYYYQAGLLYYENETLKNIQSVPYYFTTKNIIGTSKEVTVFGDFTLYVQDPYLFSLILIVGTSLVGIGLSVGTAITGDYGIERFLIYGITASSLFLIIWGHSQLIIPTSQLILSFVVAGVLGFYFLIQSSRGVAFG